MTARERFTSLEIGSRDFDFVRLEENDLDTHARELFDELDSLDEDAVSQWRRELDDDTAAVLDLVAKRAVVLFLRHGESDFAVRALALFCLQRRVEEVPWETWLKGLLVLTRESGLDLETLDTVVRAWAEPAFVDRFVIARDALERISTLRDVHLVVTQSIYGAGLLELTLSPAGSMGSTQNASIRATGLAGGGGDSEGPDESESGFGAESDLVGLSVALADAVDEAGLYQTSEIRHDQVPATLFELDFAEPFLPAVGVLSFSALDENEGEIYTVFVAELYADEDVTEWGESAGQDVAVVTRDRRLVVFMLSPFAEVGAEVFDADLDVAAEFLDTSAPPDWDDEVSIFVDGPDDESELDEDVVSHGEESTTPNWEGEPEGDSHE